MRGRNKILKKYINKRIVKFCELKLEEMDTDKFAISKGLMNSSCHWNSYNNLKLYSHKQVAVICESSGGGNVMVHFINQNSDGNYYDDTLGSMGLVRYYYYKIREYNTELKHNHHIDMGAELEDLKKWVLLNSLNKYIAKFIIKFLNVDKYL